MTVPLHEEMTDILRTHGNTMHIVDLANAVNRRGVYRKGNGSAVTRIQISARINKRRAMFEQSEGMVTLAQG